MNWKAAILLFVVFFALAVPTVAVSFNAPKLSRFSTSRSATLDTVFEPMGDPIGGGGFPL